MDHTPQQNPSLEFHYKREDRISLATPFLQKAINNKGKKKNTPLLITGINLVVLMLFIVFVFPTIQRLQKEKSIPGYKMNLQAILYEDKVLISLKIEKNSESNTTEESITAVFSIPGQANRIAEGFLPAEKNKPVYLRADFPLVQEAKIVRAKIAIPGKPIVLLQTKIIKP